MAARRAPQTTLRTLVGAIAAAGVLLAAAVPAAAAPSYFVEVKGSRLRVDGDFEPLVGHFSGTTYDDVVWFSESDPDRIWSGGHHGATADDVFTKPALNVDMGNGYDPIVGDFSGDRRDDIYWSRQNGFTGDDVLWTTTAAHTFTATDVAHLPGTSTVLLPDSDTGPGKDDLVRLGAGTGDGTLWVFPDAGTGGPVATALPVYPSAGPLTAGDFDDNGAADLLATGGGSTLAAVWSRASSSATNFTIKPVGPGNGGTGIVGRFGKAVDDRRDVVFLSGGTAPGGHFNQARATLWESTADGTFAKSTIDLGTTSFYVVPVQGTSRDLLLMAHVGINPLYTPSPPSPPINGDTVWYQTTTGPVARATGISQLLSGGATYALPGRFATTGRQDVFAYSPGTRIDRLFKIR